MRKEEFIRRLELLLSDIPDEEKRDAIEYYRDYLEEAGPEREEEVLREFGSPERIAALIRTDLLGGMKEAGEFTEQGFADARFQTAAYPAVVEAERARQQEQEETKKGERGNTSEPAENYGSAGRRRGAWWKYLLIGAVLLLAFPFLVAIALGTAGSAAGVICTLVGILVVLACLTVAAVLGGVAALIFGLFHLVSDLWIGLLFTGLGMVSLGAGLLLVFCSYQFYVRFLPWLVRSLIRVCRRLAAGGRMERGEEKEGRS